MSKYIIVDETRGVFLGSFSASLSDNYDHLRGESFTIREKTKIYDFFADTNPFGSAYAPAFNSLLDAERYVINNLDKKELPGLKVVRVETDEEYASIIDIVKGGYTAYTFSMLDSMEMGNNTMH